MIFCIFVCFNTNYGHKIPTHLSICEDEIFSLELVALLVGALGPSISGIPFSTLFFYIFLVWCVIDDRLSIKRRFWGNFPLVLLSFCIDRLWEINLWWSLVDVLFIVALVRLTFIACITPENLLCWVVAGAEVSSDVLLIFLSVQYTCTWTNTSYLPSV